MPTPEAKAEELWFMGAAIFQALPDPHLIIDQDVRIRHVNNSACLSFGYDHDELVDQPIEILIPDLLHEKHREHVKRYMADPKARPMGVGLTVKAKRKSGILVPIEVSLSPITRSHDKERRIIVRIVFKDTEVLT